MIVGSVTFGNGSIGEIHTSVKPEKPAQEAGVPMKKHHYMFLVVVVILAYLAGVAFPSAGRPIVSKLGIA